ncbi:MAG TPA: hypothetical protein VKQ09_04095 [Sphingomonas sp.]|nr:hypothetical protein [Sphingomonas sp.]
MTSVPSALLLGGALLTAAASLIAPALAQTDPYQPTNNGSAAASQTVPSGQVAPGQDPGTTSLNSGVGNSIRSTKIVNAANQAQYEADLAAYDAAMRAHGRAVARQDAHYAQQQRAYAEAMDAWRIQDAACRRGHQKACAAPAPDPANYY